MDREIALHFRDQLRDARATALKDAEAFEQAEFAKLKITLHLPAFTKTFEYLK